jgi:hypothetical protein
MTKLLKKLLKKLFGAGQGESRGTEERRPDSVGDEVESRGTVHESQDTEDDGGLFDPFPDPVEIEIGDVFDLHSIPPREVRAVVGEYLREARRKGFRVVRIIHGKGVGVQREVVRSVLARTPFVERFADAPAEAGGWGATVAFLSPPERTRD